MVFDFSELLGRIVTLYGTRAAFAEALGMSRSQLSDRLNGKTDFQLDEIYAICELLNIPATEIGRYFLTPKV